MEIPGYDKHHLEWKFQGGGGGMDIFWNYTLKKTQWRGPKAVLGCQIWHKCQHFSAHYGYFFTLNPTKVPGYLESTQFRDEHPDNPGHKNALIT